MTAVGVANINVRASVFAQDERHPSAVRRRRRARVHAWIARKRPPGAALQIVHINIRVAGLVGRIIKDAPAGHPGGIAANGVVLGHLDGPMTVVIGDVEFAVLSIFNFESNLGPRDALAARDSFHHRIGQSFRTRCAAGVFCGQQICLVHTVAELTAHVAIVASPEKVLRLVRAGDFKPLNLQIESQRGQGFARVAFQGYRNEPRVTFDVQLPFLGGSVERTGPRPQEKCASEQP